MSLQKALENLPPHIEHIGQNNFRIKRKFIDFADSLANQEGFCNPRRYDLNGTTIALGLDEENIKELKESIQTSGLLQPLNVRCNENFENIQLIAGERRLRSIDQLLEENAECFDSHLQKSVPASELYEYVDCKLHYNINDEQAYKIAWAENDKNKSVGDAANIAWIKTFVGWDWDEKKIQNVTGKSITWVRDSIALTELDSNTFTALSQGFVNRSAALDLLEIGDVKTRHKQLKLAIKKAEERLGILKKNAEEDLNKFKRKALLTKEEMDKAEKQGNKRKASQLAAKFVKIGDRIDKKGEKLDEVEARIPVVGRKDLDKIKIQNHKPRTNSSVQGTGKRLTMSKIQKHWKEPCEAFRKANYDSSDIEGVDKEDVRLVCKLMNAIEVGDRDIFGILKRHKNTKREAIS